MVGKKYLEVGVVHIMDAHVDGVVLSTGVGRILNSLKLYIGEVAYNFYFFNVSILFHDLLYELLAHLLQPTDEEFPDQDALVDLFD